MGCGRGWLGITILGSGGAVKHMGMECTLG